MSAQRTLTGPELVRRLGLDPTRVTRPHITADGPGPVRVEVTSLATNGGAEGELFARYALVRREDCA